MTDISGLDPSTLTYGDLEALLLEAERLRLERDLYEFVREAWHVVDPATFIDSWAIQAVCDHLMSCVDGYIPNLLVNIPPRMSKTTICSVLFCGWVWAQRDVSPLKGPQVKFLCASYGLNLALDAARKTRLLVESDWYQKRWGDRFSLLADQNTIAKFGNDKGGLRECVSTGSATTGKGGAILLADDINNVMQSHSDLVTATARDWWDGAFYNRLNDLRQGFGCRIVIQQRISRKDISEHLIENSQDEWTHLMLPMRYEPHRSPTTVLAPDWATDDGLPIEWADPRTEEGELLWPERFGDNEVTLLEKTMGPAKAAGQLQQSPVVGGGGIIERLWWQPWDKPKFPDSLEFVVASLDCAYGAKQHEGDFSALTIWGVWRDSGETTGVVTRDHQFGQVTSRIEKAGVEADVPKVIMMHAWQGRVPIHELVTVVAKECKQFKVDTLLIENKASGISVAQEVRRLYAHEPWGVRLVDPLGVDKVSRTFAIQHLFSEGLVHAPEDRVWAQMVITQCEEFPKGKHDDLHDTVTMAMNWLRQTGMIQRGEERTAELSEKSTFTGNSGDRPLYPV